VRRRQFELATRRSPFAPRVVRAGLLAALLCAAPAVRAQQPPDTVPAPSGSGAAAAPAAAVAPVAPVAPATPGAAAAQLAPLAPVAGGTLVRPLGPFYGFKDTRDASRFVMVFLDGVEVVQGARTLRGDTLVVVLLPDAKADARTGGPASEAPGVADDGQNVFIKDARLAELYLDGHVSVVEGDETITGASSFLLDNATGVATVVKGELRSFTKDGETIVARYDLLHRLRDGSSQMTGLSYTNCDHANPHWHIETPDATLTPTPEGRILETAGNTVRWGDVPVMWWPGLDLNIDDNQLLLHRFSVGSSTRFGYELETVWGGDATDLATGVADLFGHEGKVRAKWELEENLYSKRGLFTQPKIKYRTDDSFGTLFGSYINDSADKDFLGQPIKDHHRGRIDLEHRTKIDAHKTLDIEVSAISDANYLQEYYEKEYREEKPQETYVSYRDVVDNHMWGVQAQTRLNDFDTQVEYLPEVTHRIAGEQFGDAFVTMKDFISNARLLEADDSGVESSKGVLRAGSSTEITRPWDLENGDRVSLKAGQNLTGFSNQLHGGATLRYAYDVGAQWSRTYVGTGEAHSELWNIEGLRRIVELRAGYFNLFALNKRPDELIQIDQVEQLDRAQVVTLDLRDRIQTHQDDKVATLLDTELLLPLYPGRNSFNDENTVGPLLVDTRWTPRANITGLQDATLRWRATLDYETRHYKTSYASFTTAIGEGRQFTIGNSAVAGQFNFVTTTVDWQLNPKWAFAVFLEQDTRNNDKVRSGVRLRQKAHCWYIGFELSNSRAESFTGQNKDETSFTITLTPVGLKDNNLARSAENSIF